MKKHITRWLALVAGLLMTCVSTQAIDYTFTAEEIAAGTVKGPITPNAYGASTASKKIANESGHIVVSLSSSADTAVMAPTANAAITFTIAAGQGTITAIELVAASNGSTAGGGCVLYWTDQRSYTFSGIEAINAPGNNDTDETKTHLQLNPVEGTTEFSIFKRVKVDNANDPTQIQLTSGKSFPSSTQTPNIESVTITVEPACTAPILKYMKSGGSTYETTMPNDLSIQNASMFFRAEDAEGNVIPGVWESSNTEIAIAANAGGAGNELGFGDLHVYQSGSFTLSFTPTDNDTYCTVSDIEVVVPSSEPVTEATITGPTEAYTGAQVTLTCEAENATSYQWYNGTTAIDRM